MVRHCVSPGEDRVHSVYRYTNQIYKIVQWNRPIAHFGPGPADTQKHYDKKLDSSLSRTRRLLLEKALCNPWAWFCTFTISKDKYDRTDLKAWYKVFSEWIKYQRKKGLDIKYLIVPERHADGSWHAHALFAGLPKEELTSFRDMDARGYRSADGHRLPQRLINSDYYN